MYAFKRIDDKKLEYLGYNYYQDVVCKMQHSRLNCEISRRDFKKEVYKKLLKIIALKPS
jgi:beta-glucosidase/6-phospho-beta-glucosidase/beta-galactosidase